MTTLREAFATPPARLMGKPRKVANNTFKYETAQGSTVTRLHLTDIVEHLPEARIKLDTGGWKTATTKARMNDALSYYQIYSDRGVWYVHMRGTTQPAVPFFDGMILPDAFDKPAQRAKADKAAAAQAKLKLAIKKFVDKTLADGVVVPKPHAGDCWNCLMFDKEEEVVRGKNASFVIKTPARNRDNEHLLSHIKEGYMHGSLIVNAYRAAGYVDNSIAFTCFSEMPYYKHMRRIVKRYLQKRLGMAV